MNLGFSRILKAKDFASQGQPKVCFKHLIMQPRPLILFTWDGWWQDMQVGTVCFHLLYVLRFIFNCVF